MPPEQDARTIQPVYVLGAGFSAAISEHMPLTDGVGNEVKLRLQGDLDLDDLGPVGFEDWLSVRVASMPYLEGHENQRRLADAQRAISVIAEVIEERTVMAAAQPVPMWLQRLLAIWHLERALIVTFNYDNLVERAVNQGSLNWLEGNDPGVVRADDVVYPSPVPPPAVTYDDFGAGRPDSFQLLKVHGSVNWYWNAGDPAGASLTRTRERSQFENVVAGDRDTSGISLLDRFLIPPVATKSDYYTPPLTKILWRIAGAAIKRTSRLTLLGYSMPPTDRATTEMLRSTPDNADIDVVDRFARDEAARGSLLGRAKQLSDRAPGCWDGGSCVSDYVTYRTNDLIDRLRDSLRADSNLEPGTSVVAVIPTGSARSRDAITCAIVHKGDAFKPVEIVDNAVRLVNGGSAIEAALNSAPQGSYQQADFVTVGRLRGVLDLQRSFELESNGRRWVAIGAEEQRLNRSKVLRLHLAPA